jgi:hypothetical protein
MRTVIGEAVAAAVAPLERRVEELSARLAAVEGVGGPSGALEQKRPSTARTARAKGASDGKAEAGSNRAVGPETKADSGDKAGR